MARKKKKKKKAHAAPAKTEESFNNPFNNLKLPEKTKVKSPGKSGSQTTAPKKPEVAKVEASKVVPGIDPLEAALFLNSMGNIHKVEHDKPKVPGPTPLEVAKLEDDLALAELESLLGQSQSWEIEITADKDYFARAPGVSRDMAKRLHKGEIPPGKSIDLHGMTRQEAHQHVRRVLIGARLDHHQCLHVVTGRGQGTTDGHGVLKEALPGWLTTAPLNAHTLAVVTAPGRLGGQGAYLILIRRPAKS